MKNPCEDYGYEMQRQERIDAMSNEWIDLRTIEDVARAKVEGWDIEARTFYDGWVVWLGGDWSKSAKYRGRPAQPKTYKVKLLGVFTGNVLAWYSESASFPANWKRVPSEDKEIEVVI
jgi:hypothetical protein